jgi:hypothetical protein
MLFEMQSSVGFFCTCKISVKYCPVTPRPWLSSFSSANFTYGMVLK